MGASAAKAAPPTALAEARLADPPLVVSVIEVKRTDPDVLTVTFTLTNFGAQPVRLGSTFAAAADDAGTLADSVLFDESGRRKYYVLRDRENRAACPVVGDLQPGEQAKVPVRFPAPLRDTRVVTIQVPHLPPFEKLPVS